MAAEERRQRTMERNAQVQRMQLGHHGVELRYLIVGEDDGVPLVMTSGGQSSGIDTVVAAGGAPKAGEAPDVKDADFLILARRLAQHHGFRVLLHDRVNTGGSSFYLGREVDAEDSSAGTSQDARSAEFRGDGEPRLQAFFLRELMVATGFARAFLWGNSSGSRMSCHLAAMYPEHVRGLILHNITGGPRAARTLAHNYYTQYLPAAAATNTPTPETVTPVLVPPAVSLEKLTRHDLYFGLVARRPENAHLIRGTPAAEFAEVLKTWSDFLLAGNGQPIVGASADTLGSITCGAIVVFDHVDDGMHTPDASRALAAALGNCKDCVIDKRHAVWMPRVLAFLGSCESQ